MTAGKGYTDPSGLYIYGEADEFPAGEFSELLNKLARSIPAVARYFALQVVGEHPSVVAEARAAVLQAVASLNVALRNDPGMSVALASDSTLLRAWVDSLGRVALGIQQDGTVTVQKLRLEGGNTIEGYESDNVDWAPYVDAVGRLPEFYMVGGRIAESSIDVIESRLKGTATAGPIDIWLNAGQSKAQGYAQYPAPMFGGDARIARWDAVSSEWGVHPAQRLEYLGWAFARRYARDHLQLGRRVGIVDAAEGSTGFSSTSINPAPGGYTFAAGGTWDGTLVADPKNLYVRLLARARAALLAAPVGSRIAGVLWSQGEQDRAAEDAAPGWYAARFDAMVAQLRLDLALPTLPVIVGSMTPETEAQPISYAMAAALRDTPRRLLHTAYVVGPAGMSDSAGAIHYSAPGEAEYGYSFAKAVPAAITSSATCPPVAPQGVDVERSGGLAVIRWSPPPARHTAFVLETSTNSGATWTAAALSAPLTLSHSLNVAAGTPLWVRMRATNEVGTSTYSREVHA